jgi:hypothetical protein
MRMYENTWLMFLSSKSIMVHKSRPISGIKDTLSANERTRNPRGPKPASPKKAPSQPSGSTAPPAKGGNTADVQDGNAREQQRGA